jgi:hypothetical protein
LPDPSLAAQTTVVSPIGNRIPEAGAQLTVGAGSTASGRRHVETGRRARRRGRVDCDLRRDVQRRRCRVRGPEIAHDDVVVPAVRFPDLANADTTGGDRIGIGI